mgnify:CR=1 FL=1
MGAKVREDISSIISSMLHTSATADLSRMLTSENMFDAAVLRAFLLDDSDEEDTREFFKETSINSSFLRGFMAGLIQALMIERGHGEAMGRMSHAEFADIFDAARAYHMENAME